MRNPRVLDFLADGTPWAIEANALETILSIAKRENNLEAVLQARGEPLANTRNIEIRDGVALIPINGPLFPRANLFMEVSGAYSVEMLALDLAAAEKNPDVSSAVLMLDSPGGRTTMINEFSNQVRAFSKPIYTYVVGQAASAAYWIAAATDRIIMDAAALTGSIGTVIAMGKKDDGTIEIVSSNAPDKRPDINTDEGRTVIQAVVDDMESVFINAVAAYRGLPAEQIAALRGGVFVGAKAVEKGLADEIGSLESVINQLQMENPMDLQKLKADHKEIYQAAFNEGVASINAEALTAEGAKAERDRYAAVMAHESYAGREATANKMLASGNLGAEQIVEILATVPKAAAAPKAQSEFERMMAKEVGVTNIGAGADTDGGGEETDEQLAANVVALYNKTTGKGTRK